MSSCKRNYSRNYSSLLSTIKDWMCIKYNSLNFKNKNHLDKNLLDLKITISVVPDLYKQKMINPEFMDINKANLGEPPINNIGELIFLEIITGEFIASDSILLYFVLSISYFIKNVNETDIVKKSNVFFKSIFLFIIFIKIIF
jgi:hypothetical protein